jgi:hypothetical protein
MGGSHHTPHCKQVEQNSLYQWTKESFLDESNFELLALWNSLNLTSPHMNWHMQSSKDSAPKVTSAEKGCMRVGVRSKVPVVRSVVADAKSGRGKGSIGSALEPSGNDRWSMTAGWPCIDRLSAKGGAGGDWRVYHDRIGIATWCDGGHLVHRGAVGKWRAVVGGSVDHRRRAPAGAVRTTFAHTVGSVGRSWRFGNVDVGIRKRIKMGTWTRFDGL